MTTTTFIDPLEQSSTPALVDPFEQKSSEVPEYPIPEQKPSYDATEGLKSIAGATGIGAAAGALAPELLRGASVAMSGVPQLQRFAPFVRSAGEAMRGQRVRGAASGALGGAVGETGGQTVEAMGGGATAAEAARLAGGMFAPEIVRGVTAPLAKVGGYGLSVMLNKLLPGSTIGTGMRTIGQILEGRERGVAVDLTEQQRRFIDDKLQALRGGAESQQPLKDIFALLKNQSDSMRLTADTTARQLEDRAQQTIQLAEQAQGRFVEEAERRILVQSRQLFDFGEKTRADAARQADSILRTANDAAVATREGAAKLAPEIQQRAFAEADRILAAGQAEAQKIRNDAAARISEIGQTRQRLLSSSRMRGAEVQQMMSGVGEIQTPTTIGKSLRKDFFDALDGLKKIRETNVNIYKGEAFSEAAAKEAQGARYQDTPEFREVVQTISSMIRSPDTGLLRAAPEQKAQLTKILDLLRRGEGRKDPDTGEISYTKLSFEGLEGLRRMLRDRAFGLPAEGYDAINQQQARDLAQQVEKTMEAFSPKLRTYLDKYKADSAPINKFKTKLGKAMTGQEEFDLATFVVDPALLPQQAFRSETSVQQVIETIGPEAAERAARSFVADKLRGGSTRDVAQTIDATRDWLGSFPRLAEELNALAERAGIAERVTAKRTKLADLLRTEMRRMPSRARREAAVVEGRAEQRAERIGRAGAQDAAQTMKEAERKALDTLTTGKAKATEELARADPLVEKFAGIVRAQEAELRSAAQKAERQAIEAATKEAGALTAEAAKVRSEAEARIKVLLAGKEPVERVRDFLLGAKTEEWDAITPILSTLEGREKLSQAVGQLMATRFTASPKKAVEDWKNLGYKLVDRGLMNQDRYEEVLRELQKVAVTPMSAVVRSSVAQRLVRNAFAGYVAPAVVQPSPRAAEMNAELIDRGLLNLIQGEQNAAQTRVQPQVGR